MGNRGGGQAGRRDVKHSFAAVSPDPEQIWELQQGLGSDVATNEPLLRKDASKPSDMSDVSPQCSVHSEKHAGRIAILHHYP
ncbi:uncharacterized protein LOC119308918 isoform X2 [Triticum dicoccoides]|uniref:uncharacterized protein LOC119308918 isoform X2 n=1 Tax=Triticum dicoccoides TaxID=85692 RepID=UPI001891C2D8|nr:uncharacterized protein LOC119308918 isoform X2 [Triticum dicoccoides]